MNRATVVLGLQPDAILKPHITGHEPKVGLCMERHELLPCYKASWCVHNSKIHHKQDRSMQ